MNSFLTPNRWIFKLLFFFVLSALNSDPSTSMDDPNKPFDDATLKLLHAYVKGNDLLDVTLQMGKKYPELVNQKPTGQWNIHAMEELLFNLGYRPDNANSSRRRQEMLHEVYQICDLAMQNIDFLKEKEPCFSICTFYDHIVKPYGLDMTRILLNLGKKYPQIVPVMQSSNFIKALAGEII